MSDTGGGSTGHAPIPPVRAPEVPGSDDRVTMPRWVARLSGTVLAVLVAVPTCLLLAVLVLWAMSLARSATVLRNQRAILERERAQVEVLRRIEKNTRRPQPPEAP